MLPTWTIVLFLELNCAGAVRYVDVRSTNPSPPFTSWATAAANIQEAVDASTNGDRILVAAGVYREGGRALHGGMTNRVAVPSALTIQSVDGPALTALLQVRIGCLRLSSTLVYLCRREFERETGLRPAAGGFTGPRRRKEFRKRQVHGFRKRKYLKLSKPMWRNWQTR